MHKRRVVKRQGSRKDQEVSKKSRQDKKQSILLKINQQIQGLAAVKQSQAQQRPDWQVNPRESNAKFISDEDTNEQKDQ